MLCVQLLLALQLTLGRRDGRLVPRRPAIGTLFSF
jgi:hypothetical protein